MKVNEVHLGDSLEILQLIASESIDLIYLDPPFFTNKTHSSINKQRSKKFSFDDLWSDLSEYAQFMSDRISEMHRVLKASGSIFIHCDKNANFIIRALLDKVFGAEQFKSEIIWTYKRWSNSGKRLLPAHQTIFYYSKSDKFHFNTVFQPYSETTNIDQILQLRSRDSDGVTKYAQDENGNTIYGTEKKGVPLSDVWEIPYLNPKAKERTGYPTQKPILLLERIIELASNPKDVILDPFCGSGTTLVAAKLLDRNYLGIDQSPEAVNLSKQRLLNPVRTESNLLRKGRSSYINVDTNALNVLHGLDYIPVQRNSGIDAFLKSDANKSMIPVRVQRVGESLQVAASKLSKSIASKNFQKSYLIRTHEDKSSILHDLPDNIVVVDSVSVKIKKS